MKRPHEAQINVWNPHTGAWDRQSLGRFRRAERARRAVLRWLDAHPVVTTRGCYHRDVARGAWGEVRNAKRPELCGETMDPSVAIVPSVGELGYW